MKTRSATEGVPELVAEFSANRFFWVFTDHYVKAIRNKTLAWFWQNIPKILRNFDTLTPTDRRVRNPTPVHPKRTPATDPPAHSQVPANPKIPAKSKAKPKVPAKSQLPVPAIDMVDLTLANAGPTQQRRKVLSPIPSSDDESYVNSEAERKKDKGKGRMNDEDDEKKRKPVKSTGRVRKTPCAGCLRKKIPCVDQAGGKACFSCALVKMRCKEPQPGDEPAPSAPTPSSPAPSAPAPSSPAPSAPA